MTLLIILYQFFDMLLNELLNLTSQIPCVEIDSKKSTQDSLHQQKSHEILTEGVEQTVERSEPDNLGLLVQKQENLQQTDPHRKMSIAPSHFKEGEDPNLTSYINETNTQHSELIEYQSVKFFNLKNNPVELAWSEQSAFERYEKRTQPLP